MSKEDESRKNKGIGEGNKTLKEIKEFNNKILEETGHYWGIKDLTLKRKDPIKYEVFCSRLFACMIAAREKVKAVAASPLVREVAEHLTGLYTCDGDAVVQSTGIQVHTLCLERVIEWMIDNDYEEEVGFDQGDIFGCNDNAIAGMHPADVYDMMPILYDGELIGWATNVIMEPEIGAIGPGGCMPVLTTERFTDGFRECCEKIGTDDKLRKDFEVRVRFQLRNPDMFMLSRKAALAAITSVRDEILAIVDEFGIEYYRRAIREINEESRRNQISRVKARTVPGRARNVFQGEYYLKDLPILPYHALDTLRIVPMEINIEPSGKIVIDCDGAGAWGWHSMNVYPMGMEGGLSIGLIHTLAYDGKANRGTMIPTELKLPPDTIVNPTTIHLPTANCWSVVLSFFGLFLHSVSRAYYARGFKEEMCGHGGGMHLWEVGGKNQYGQEPYGFFMADGSVLEAGSAFAIRDGLEIGQEVYTTEPDMGSIEIWELVYPLLYLGRNCSTESAAPGKFRSGRAGHGVYMVHGTDKLLVSSIPLSPRKAILPNTGVNGGYPGLNAYLRVMYDTNMDELIRDRKPLPSGSGDLLTMVEGKLEHIKPTSLSKQNLQDGDLIEADYHAGSGGYGDPIERSPELVREDFNNKAIKLETARKIYCVEAYFDDDRQEWLIDEEKTKELRDARMKERLNQAIPVREWWQSERKRVADKALHPYLLEMYASSSASHRGPKWFKEFKQFWALPEDFSF